MELTSPSYFFLLTIVFLFYWILPGRARAIFLLLASYAFYALWDSRYLAVLVCSTLLDFYLALVMQRQVEPGKRQKFLVLSIASNLGILGFFKYVGFFSEVSSTLLPALNVSNFFDWKNIFIPLGVSFYTFHSISYMVDVFNGRIPACESIGEYALYVSFFPKLISGPIERTESFLPQIQTKMNFEWSNFFQSLRWIVYGLFLKLVVGDRIGAIVDDFFQKSDQISTTEHWLGFYSYSLQIYADFLGYTLLARGSAALFGFKLNPNFLSPYFSATPREFWRRWHISLSTWFRDYVYIPLGGARKNRFRNVLISMALAGLWHGAELKFVFWGIFHGTILCLQLVFLGDAEPKGRWRRTLGILVTFHLVSVGWIFFKAKSFLLGVLYLKRMFVVRENVFPSDYNVFLYFCFLAGLFALFQGVIFLLDLFERQRKLPIVVDMCLRGAAFGVLVLAIAIFGTSNAEPFLYFYF